MLPGIRATDGAPELFTAYYAPPAVVLRTALVPCAFSIATLAHARST